METFIYSSIIPAPVDKVFAWHERPGALERLTPPFDPVVVESRSGGIRDGGRVVLRMKAGMFPVRWVAEHYGFIEGRQFVDRQVSGPFAAWTHTHLFEDAGEGRCRMTDRIEYALPGGRLAACLAGGAVRATLNRVFRWRHAVVAHDAANQFLYQVKPMKILVSGSTGLIGTALIPALESAGHSVTRLVRARKDPAEAAIEWHPEQDRLDALQLEGFNAVIHLAGENIAGRWTPEKKEAIRESRVHGTRLLSEALARLGAPPHTLLCASASGIYGDRGDEELIEESPPGTGFLADLCRQWEAATDPAAMVGVRVVNLRFSMVLSPRGGALGMMLPPFRLGLGGPLGGGNQFTSWIAIDDVVGAIEHALGNEGIKGAVNITAPHPVRNRDFADTLARVLHRPSLLPAPAVALRFLYGEMADEVLLASQRVIPERLLMTGYRFQFPELGGALRHLLGK